MASISILNGRAAVTKVDETMQYSNSISIDKSVLAQLGGSNCPDYVVEHILNEDIHLTKEEVDKVKDLIASAGTGISQALLNEIYSKIDAKAESSHTHLDDEGFVVTAYQINETDDRKFVSLKQVKSWDDKYTKSEVDQLLSEISVSGGTNGTQILEGSSLPSINDVNEGDLFILRTSSAVQLYKLKDKRWSYLYDLNGRDGVPGATGEAGKSFTYEDFTEEQLQSLTGPQGPRGEAGKAFTYADFTDEQLQALTGPQGPVGSIGPEGPAGKSADMSQIYTKDEVNQILELVSGEGGDMVYPDNLSCTVVNEVGGFKPGDKIAGMTLAEIIEKILCYNEDLVAVEPPTFLGTIAYKAVSSITYADLDVSTVEQNTIEKSEVTYAHSAGTVLSRSCVIAFPKTFGTITGVYDGSGTSLTGSYEWIETVLTVPGAGEVEYILGGAKKGQIYNNSSIVKWIIA